jgi:hypothetical protein
MFKCQKVRYDALFHLLECSFECSLEALSPSTG